MNVLIPPQAYSGSLVLVNAAHPCRFVPPRRQLQSLTGGELLERRAAALLEELLRQTDPGGEIAVVSGFRSRCRQRRIWEDALRERGEAFARRYVALPGRSEHETGLAVDLGRRGERELLCPDFPAGGPFGRFRSRCAAYGFIQRYPAGKEHVTGIAPEPWHFRYVGAPHARMMEELGLVLEEYLILLRQHPFLQRPLCHREGRRSFFVGSLLPAQLPLLDTADTLLLSGDNRGGLVAAAWQEEG